MLLLRPMSRTPSGRSTNGFAVVAALLATLTAASCSSPQGPQVVIKTDRATVVVAVELALSREAIRRGLMWRDRLDDGAGMLFVFADEAERTFWMKNTPLPLDIIFIGSDLKIVSIAANTTPYSRERIPSVGPATYVLEVKGGFAAQHGIRPGMSVSLPEQARPPQFSSN